jgi:hypothetical protein
VGIAESARAQNERNGRETLLRKKEEKHEADRLRKDIPIYKAGKGGCF